MFRIIVALLILVTVSTYADDKALHDPTTPLKGMSSGAKSTERSDIDLLQLRAVIRGNGRTRAIINGKTCYIADACFGYQVYAIEKSSVILVQEGGKDSIKLSLFSSEGKK